MPAGSSEYNGSQKYDYESQESIHPTFSNPFPRTTYRAETSEQGHPIQEVVSNVNMPADIPRKSSVFSRGDFSNDAFSAKGIDAGENDDDVPIVVKPKILYQNPLTPTVLPSQYVPINKWSQFKNKYLKDFLAEFLGTLVMMFYGISGISQVTLGGVIQQNTYMAQLQTLNETTSISNDALLALKAQMSLVTSIPTGSFDDIALGWGTAVMLGFFAAGGASISGGHLNPTVTIANFLLRGFPLKKVPIYIFAQLVGAFTAGLLAFSWWRGVIVEAFPNDAWRTSTVVSSCFCTLPQPYLDTGRQFYSEFLSSSFLILGLFSTSDPYTTSSGDLFPLFVDLLIFQLIAACSYQTGAAMNLARDFGPRVALRACGVTSETLFVTNHHSFWNALVAPILGGTCGGIVYDICVFQGHESPVNWPLAVYKEKWNTFWYHASGSSHKLEDNDDNSNTYYTYEDEDNNRDSAGKVQISHVEHTDQKPGSDDKMEPENVKFKPVREHTKRSKHPITIEENILEDDSLGAKDLSDEDSDLRLSEEESSQHA